MFHGGVGWDFTEVLRGGVDLNVYDNHGTFPLTWRQYLLFVDLRSPAGYLIRFSYQRNDYNEDGFDFDDYDADMVTVSVGYRF